MKTNRIGCLVGMVLSLAGCASSLELTVTSEVPRPLLSPYPVDVGVYYDPRFRRYAYQEDSADRPRWRIATGASQTAMFDRILASMFRSVSRLESLPPRDGDAGLDGILVPEVEAMQLTLPGETETGLYEAWIKYQLRLYDAGGRLVAAWPVIGYGKTTTSILSDREEGLSFAITQALRDAGARLALEFERVPGVREWLRSIPGDGMNGAQDR